MKGKTLMSIIVLTVSSVLLVACSSAGAGSDDETGNDGGSGGTDAESIDPSEPTTDVIEEITVPEPVVNDDGSTTWVVRDKDTDALITTDVTVNVTNGSATSVDASGEFTITPDEGLAPSERTSFHVLVTGYDAVTYVERDDTTDTNIVYKERIVPELIGEWILFEVVDSSNPSRVFPVPEQTVTYRPDGLAVSTSTAFGQPDRAEWYYTARREADGTIRFGYVGLTIPEIPIRIGFAFTGPMVYGAARFPRLDESIGVLELSSTDRTYRYSRTGTDPEGDFGTGSFSFQQGDALSGGTVYTGFAGRTDNLFGPGESWVMTPDSGNFTAFTILGVPANGSASVTADSVQAVFVTNSGTRYVSNSFTAETGGSVTRDGDFLTFNFRMREEGTPITSPVYNLNGSMRTTDATEIPIVNGLE